MPQGIAAFFFTLIAEFRMAQERTPSAMLSGAKRGQSRTESAPTLPENTALLQEFDQAELGSAGWHSSQSCSSACSSSNFTGLAM